LKTIAKLALNVLAVCEVPARL